MPTDEIGINYKIFEMLSDALDVVDKRLASLNDELELANGEWHELTTTKKKLQEIVEGERS
jgi:prefoldin subunit 5